MVFGLTPQGFTPKTLQDCLTDNEAGLQAAFGTSINLEPSSVFGQQAGISAEMQADIWAQLLIVFWSQYPDTATGIALDRVCAITNIERKPATPTQTIAFLRGAHNTTIPAGSAATDSSSGIVYQLASSVTLLRTAATFARIEIIDLSTGVYTVTLNGTAYSYTGTSGVTKGMVISALQALIDPLEGITASTVSEGLNITANPFGALFSVTVSAKLSVVTVGGTGLFKAQVTGPNPLPVNDLSEINTPVAGWTTIGNPDEGIIGQDRETDEALRLRRQRARDNDLRGALEDLPDVTDARTVYNETATTNADGVPRQHLWAIVEGGDGVDIVESISEFKAAGIGTHGAQSAIGISRIDGTSITYNYERPTYNSPAIAVTYTPTGEFPPDGAARIKQALVDYGLSLRIGESLYYSRLFSPINTVPGMTVDVTINTTTNDIIAGTATKIRLLAGNITVTEVP